MRIITGRAKAGKSEYIYDQINDEIYKNTGENLILLVPDLMTYQVEYDIIERLKLEGIMNLEVLSFKRLAHKIMGEIGGMANIEDIDSFGKTMVLKKVFDENIDNLKLFNKASSHSGFIKQFNILLQELKQNLISVEMIINAGEKISNKFLKNKLSDIALIYSEYNEKMKDKFFDEEDIYNLVISNIKESNYIKNSKIWVDGFESFNQQRIQMIGEIGKYCKSLSISLNIDSKHLDGLETYDDWEAFKVIYDTFKSIQSVVEDDIEIISPFKNEIQSEEINAIERNMFSIDLKQYNKPTDNIKICSAIDSFTEVETVANEIISLVRDEDYRWKDIKIAVGDLEGYMIDIKKVFHKFGIPYFADVKKDITNSPLSKYILSILDMFIWDFRYDDVFQYLKTGFSPLDNSQINYIENYALEYGIEGSKWFKEISSEFMEEIRKIFASQFKEKRGTFKSLTTISEITDFLFHYLRLHEVDEKISKQIDSFKTKDKYEQASEYSQVWNSVINIFEQILSIGEDTEITALEYRKILEAGLLDVEISIIPPTIDRIEIGDIERIAVSKTKALFILGANEGNLDSNKVKGLLLDDEIRVLSDYDIHIINCSDFAYFKKKHMLYKLFTNPAEKLYISYALGTADGKPLACSLYINTLKMIFPKLNHEIDITNKNLYKDISNDGATYDSLVENINKHMNGIEIDDIWKAVYAWYKNNDSEKYNTMKEGFNYKNRVSQVTDEEIKKIFGEDISMTVSKLESYAECPFKFFVKNILKPEPRLTQKIEFYDLGNINHAVLEDFINKMIVQDKKIVELTDEDVFELVEESIENVLDEYSKKVTALNANSRNIYLKNKIERVLKRTALTLVKQLQKGEFTPKYTELKIGIIDEKDKGIHKSEYIDSLEIKTKDYRIKLRGIIDRVDIFEDENGDLYLSIIDYKSSAKDIDFTDTYEGIQVQLLVYLKAILEKGEKLFGKEPKVAGVFYYRIDDPIIKDKDEFIDNEILKSLKLKGFVLKDKNIIYKIDKDIGQYSDIIPAGIKKDGEFRSDASAFTEDEFDAILNYIYLKITNLSENILDGNFDINPYRKKNGSTPCKYCDYISICQFDKSIGNEYRQINDIKKDEFFDKISEKAVD